MLLSRSSGERNNQHPSHPTEVGGCAGYFDCPFNTRNSPCRSQGKIRVFAGGRRSIDMCITCNYVHSMAKMIQVRNVPDALHRSLKVRAAMAGTSLSEYLLGELREIAERPTLAEFRERLHKRKPLPIALDTGALLREERTAR
jgi:antitoxin FitA